MVAACQVALLLSTTAPLVAQEEPSFVHLMKAIRQNLELVERELARDEMELARYLQVLEKLQGGARDLAREAPMTGRDNALEAVEEARAIAEREPELDSLVFETLDRCRVEVERNVIGESGPSAAARFLAETLKLEQWANARFQSFVSACEYFKRVTTGIEDSANAHFLKSSQALERLYVLHAAALRAREPR